MSCATVEPPTEAEMDAALVFTADGYSDAEGVDHVTAPAAVRAAQRAERVAATPRASDAHSKGIARRHALHDAQMRLLSVCSDRARSADLKAKIASAVRAKADQHEMADVQAAADRQATDLRKTGADSEVCGAAQAEHDRIEVEWMAAWDVLCGRAGEVLDAAIHHPDDLVVRHDAFLCLIGTEVEPIGSDDPTSELLALTSIKDGLSQLRQATCRVDAVARDFMAFVDKQDLAYGVEPEAEAKAMAHMQAVEAFAAGSRAESFAGLAYRLSLLGSLADEIEDCASSDCEERQARASKAVEAIRDIAGNTLSLLSLPVDRRVATYYLGERNLTDLSDAEYARAAA